MWLILPNKEKKIDSSPLDFTMLHPPWPMRPSRPAVGDPEKELRSVIF
jgi:hypothetical protein